MKPRVYQFRQLQIGWVCEIPDGDLPRIEAGYLDWQEAFDAALTWARMFVWCLVAAHYERQMKGLAVR